MSKVNSTVTYKDIPGFPGYRVGTDGSVWSIRGSGRDTTDWRKLKPADNGHGYLRLVLRQDGRYRTVYVHRAVLLAFIGPCPEGMVACHGPDPNPANCHLDNLCWGTQKDNVADQISRGTLPHGERHYLSKLTEKDVRLIRRLALDGKSVAEIARIYCWVTEGPIRAILRGRTWKHVR